MSADHSDLVAQVKADLVARGVVLSGPCGAWAITLRVAWALRAEGAGLLDKPGGNQCGGFATDIIMYSSDGRLVDILQDGGGANGPIWNVTGEVRPLDQWRAPIDPGDAPPPPAPPAPPDDGVMALLQKILKRLDAQDADFSNFVIEVETMAKAIKAPTYKGKGTVTKAGNVTMAITPVKS